MNCLFPLKQLFWSIFVREMNVDGFSIHQNISNESKCYKKYFCNACISQLNVYIMDSFEQPFFDSFEQPITDIFQHPIIRSQTNAWYSVYNPPIKISATFWFEIKRKQQTKGSCVSVWIIHSIECLYILKNCRRTKFWENSGLWGPSPLKEALILVPILFPKACANLS